MLFEWDERKRRSNLAKHLIDFQDAVQVFDGPVFEKVQRRHGENRVLAIGLTQGIEIVVVYTLRGNRRRIISARRAHRDERKAYARQLEDAIEGSHGS
ncbi:MAG TPA: BrnT family toxin [Terriglobales bacterium]|nr:BrnT family toxin [Terriglobales bacterium]